MGGSLGRLMTGGNQFNGLVIHKRVALLHTNKSLQYNDPMNGSLHGSPLLIVSNGKLIGESGLQRISQSSGLAVTAWAVVVSSSDE